MDGFRFGKQSPRVVDVGFEFGAIGQCEIGEVALEILGKLQALRFVESLQSLRAIAQGAMDLPGSLVWLWRDYDPKKTSQEFTMDPAEKEKPYFRVSITNRDAW